MRHLIKQIILKSLAGILGASIIYLVLLFFPMLLFAYKIQYKQCTVYSDRSIDYKIFEIIDSSLARLSKSEMYDTKQHFRLFICNDLWRFGVFTQGSTNAGGVAQYDFMRDIFFRPCDIPNNKIIPPRDWYFAKNPFAFKDRPLSYYFAHEMTHILQSRYTGRGSWRYPTWLTEGYADHIGKGGIFDFQENLKLWHQHAPELDPSKGLYRLHHLKIFYILNIKNKSIKYVYQMIPNDSTLTRELWNLSYDPSSNDYRSSGK